MSCGGVRNRIYQSYNFGSTLIWELGEWRHEFDEVDGKIERLVLLDIANASNPPKPEFNQSRLEIEFGPHYGDNPRFNRLQDALEAVKRREGTHTVLRHPSEDELRADGETIREIDGRSWRFKWELYCLDFEEVGTHTVLFFHEAHAQYGARRRAAERVVESLHPAAPRWKNCVEKGVIDVWSGQLEVSSSPVVLTLELKNVDKWDAEFDVSLLRVVDNSNPDQPQEFSVDEDGWNWTGDGRGEEVRTIPVDDSGQRTETGVFAFTVSDPNNISIAIYRQPTRDIVIAEFVGDVNGPGRPRINPGG
jgi:hypothetical protein